MLVIHPYPCPFRYVMMVIVMKNDGGVFDYIFLMIQLMWGYTRLWVYWFFQFSSREWRRWRPGAYAARVQIIQTHPILSLLLLTLSTFAPFPLRCSFLCPPLFHHPFSSPSSLPYFCHSSSSLSLRFFFLLLSLAPLPLLFSPPISVPFSVLV